MVQVRSGIPGEAGVRPKQPRVAQEVRRSPPNFVLYFNDFLEFYVLNIRYMQSNMCP